VIDAKLSIEEQQQQMRNIVQKKLKAQIGACGGKAREE
jgi:hypothetical protein